MLTWAATFFGAAGEGLSVTAVWVLSLAAGVLAAVLVLFVAVIVAVLRLPAAPASTESKPSVFRYEKDAFVESKRIKWSDGSTSELYEENYYLPVWHSLATGQPLKVVKVRIFMIGQEPIPARVKETGQYSVDLRHGEVALFKIGRVISTDGFYSGGYVTFSDEEKSNTSILNQTMESILKCFQNRGEPLALAMPDHPVVRKRTG
jgi:hypothetical protein